MKKGVFIVFDGMDGSGKTTQARMLVELLREKSKKVLFTHEPMRNTKLGRYIEKRIRDKKNKPGKKELLELFSKDREAHLKNEIIPALKKGKTVISDRYYYSTLAYQLEKNKWKNYIRRFLKPDIAFICAVPEKIALKRINSSIKKDERRSKKKAMFEKLGVLRKLRKKYMQMKMFPEVRIIDATPSPEEIFEKIKNEMERLI
jgi:dTMP kinase